MIDQKEVVVLKGQVSKLENQATELTIASPEEMGIATELKAKLRDIGKSIKTRKEAITKPLNDALKSTRELFKPLEEHFEKAESIVDQKLLSYKRKIDEEARAKEAKIAADFEAGKIKKIETVEKKIENIERVEKTVNTDHGKVQFRKIKKVRVTDANLIPDKYWVLDEVAIRRDALAGIVVPGAEVYEEETI